MIEIRVDNHQADVQKPKEKVNRPHQIIFIEGPQTVGKTTLTFLAPTIIPEASSIRGIPSSDFLEAHSEEEIWAETESILINAVSSQSSTVIFDRSVISLASYRMRKYPPQSEYFYQKALVVLKHIGENNGGNIRFVFLESPSEECLKREERRYLISDSPLEDVQREIDVYRNIIQRLEQEGFACYLIENNGSISDLLDNFRETIK